MDITTMRIVATVASMVCFVGIWVWAWSARNQSQFDEAALLPFVEHDEKTQLQEGRHLS